MAERAETAKARAAASARANAPRLPAERVLNRGEPPGAPTAAGPLLPDQGLTAARLTWLQRTVGNASATMMVARQPAPPTTPARADAVLARTLLPVAAGDRSYEVAVVGRARRAFLVVTMTGGTRERFEAPLTAAGEMPAAVAFPNRETAPDRSTLTIDLRVGRTTTRSLGMTIVPSPYYTGADAVIRPDRLRVATPVGSVSKDFYPTGSSHRLSGSMDAAFSTAVPLPPSGSASDPRTVVVEVAPGAGGRGTFLVLKLSTTGEVQRIPLAGVDVMNGSVRLTGMGAASADDRGNPRMQVTLEHLDAAGGSARTLTLTFTSWRNAGAREEGYTYRVEGAAGGPETNGFVVPPDLRRRPEFHVRALSSPRGVRESISGDQEYNSQVTTASAGGLVLRFHRASPDDPQVKLHLGARTGAVSRMLTLDHPLPTFRPRVVEDTGGDQGRLTLSLDGSGGRQLIVAWSEQAMREDVPFLERGSHVVLRSVATSRVGLVLTGRGLETTRLTWYQPPLPDDAIMPPKWRQVQTTEVGWLRVRDNRFILRRIVDTQVTGARIAQMLGERYAIEWIHLLPVVGELVLLGEAIAGREIISGRRLDPTERVLHGVFAALGTVLLAAGGLRGTTGATRTARMGEAVAQVRRGAALSEADARALVEAVEHVSPQEQAFLRQLQADVRAGRTVDAARLSRLREILVRVNRTFEARRALLDTLRARVRQIEAARGDINVFKGRFNVLTSTGDTARPLADLAHRLDQLLTEYRRVRTITGGGRAGKGVSTYIESLDGRFSIRITHNQVGPNPVGTPPAPRIHVYMGPVSGHGKHVILPTGTTLTDILRALKLAP